MTKIRNVKSEIENQRITIAKAITIHILNFLELSFTLFLGILSYETKEKAKLLTFESLGKSLNDKELWMKNPVKQWPITPKGLRKRNSNCIQTRLKTPKILSLI